MTRRAVERAGATDPRETPRAHRTERASPSSKNDDDDVNDEPPRAPPLVAFIFVSLANSAASLSYSRSNGSNDARNAGPSHGRPEARRILDG